MAVPQGLMSTTQATGVAQVVAGEPKMALRGETNTVPVVTEAAVETPEQTQQKNGFLRKGFISPPAGAVAAGEPKVGTRGNTITQLIVAAQVDGAFN